MLIIPLNLDSVLLLLHNSKLAYFDRQAVAYFLVVLRHKNASDQFQTDSMLRKVQCMYLADVYVMP